MTALLITSLARYDLYFIDLVSGKFSSSETLKIFKRTAKKDGKGVLIKIEQEPGAGSKLLINAFKRDKELKRYHIRADKVRMAKNVRSFDLEALSEDGRVYFVKADWNNKLIDQLVSFTGADGGEDDIVDTATGSAKHWLRPRRKINV